MALLLSLFSCSLEEKEIQEIMVFDNIDKTLEDTVYFGQTKYIEFPFINNGGGTLDIVEILPQCGCTKGEFSLSTASNHKGFVNLIFIPTKGMIGRKWRRTAFIKTNKGDIEISFEVNVR